MLTLQSITLGLTTPVMIAVAGVSAATALTVGLGLALACLLLAGMLRAPWAYALGWALQAATIALGLVVSIMFLLGPIFGALWAGAVYLGNRIERERAAAYAAWDARPDPA